MLGYIISDKYEINVEEHEIQSFDILHKTNLNIFVVENNKVLYKNDIGYNALKNRHIEILEWFKNSGYEFRYNYKDAINWACEYGYVQVLEWFKNSGYEFKYDNWAINHAIEFGNVETLDWFKNSGYKFKYNKWALNIKYNHDKVLKFFENRNVKKVIKWSYKPNKTNKFHKTIKYKTKNNYIKGYNKN